jgi:hypothetical protein
VSPGFYAAGETLPPPEEIIAKNIELNIEMPEGIFDIPEEVKAIMNKN